MRIFEKLLMAGRIELDDATVDVLSENLLLAAIAGKDLQIKMKLRYGRLSSSLLQRRSPQAEL